MDAHGHRHTQTRLINITAQMLQLRARSWSIDDGPSSSPSPLSSSSSSSSNLFQPQLVFHIPVVAHTWGLSIHWNSRRNRHVCMSVIECTYWEREINSVFDIGIATMHCISKSVWFRTSPDCVTRLWTIQETQHCQPPTQSSTLHLTIEALYWQMVSAIAPALSSIQESVQRMFLSPCYLLTAHDDHFPLGKWCDINPTIWRDMRTDVTSPFVIRLKEGIHLMREGHLWTHLRTHLHPLIIKLFIKFPTSP